MFTTDIARTLAAVACTVVFSATALVGAVGPATQVGQQIDAKVAATPVLTA